MYDFILQLSLVTSLSVIIYLLASSIARIKEDNLIVTGETDGFFERWLGHRHIVKIDRWLNDLFTKCLRLFRVIVLKIDNLLSHHISLNNKRNNLLDDRLTDDLDKGD